MCDKIDWSNVQVCKEERCTLCNYFHVKHKECHKCGEEARYHCVPYNSRAFLFCSKECFEDFFVVGKNTPVFINPKIKYYNISECDLHSIYRLLNVLRESDKPFDYFIYENGIKELEK